jgi:hypothetical protein
MIAMPVSLECPWLGFGLVCCALPVYLRPEPLGTSDEGGDNGALSRGLPPQPELDESHREAAAMTRGSRGPKVRSGSGSIGTGRSIKSIPTQERFFTPSSPTASSLGSPGSMESCGAPPGKVTRVI